MKTRNSAFYREICILRILVKMGYIDKKALPHIIDIAAKDYMKSYRDAGKKPYLNYYRDRDAREIDVIIEDDGNLCPLEIKKQLLPISGLPKPLALSINHLSYTALLPCSV